MLTPVVFSLLASSLFSVICLASCFGGGETHIVDTCCFLSVGLWMLLESVIRLGDTSMFKTCETRSRIQSFSLVTLTIIYCLSCKCCYLVVGILLVYPFV